MNEERFDGLAKVVAAGTSRRGLLAGLVAGVAAAGWRGHTRAQGTITREACQAKGGTVKSEYSACSGGSREGCGLFQYSWINWCNYGGWELIDQGCGPCLF